MVNEALFTVTGYVATDPTPGETPSGIATLSMRLGWTPRRRNAATGDWTDEPTSFATVQCFRRLAENAGFCLHKGDPVVVTGTLRIREYEAKDGTRRTAVEILASSIGHDLNRALTRYRKGRPPSQEGKDQEAATGAEAPGDEVPDDGTPGHADDKASVMTSLADELLEDVEVDESDETLEPVPVPA